jgi:serine/threonine-protein kinase
VAASLPGGDPLAAALAAGETPSPQLVAAAAVQGALSPRTAVGLGVVFLVSLVVVTLWQWSPPAVFRITRSAEVLAAQSRDLLASLGYTEPPVDVARGFRYRTPDWRDPAIVNHPRPWSRLAGLRPAAVFFWYREQPSLMAGGEAGRIGFETLALPIRTVTGPTANDPLFEPGSLYVERAPDGSLDTLVVRPSPAWATTPATAAIDWSRLFAEARLDMGEFRDTAPDPALAVPGDQRVAWIREPADDGDALRVEAAEFAGRPVLFRVLSPRTTFELGASPFYLAIRTTTARVLVVASLGFLTIAYLGAAFFMRRNLKLGRGDRRGAGRIARVVAGMMLMSAMLSAGAPFDSRLFGTLHGAAAVALFAGAWCWAFYLAIEPFLRRQWPRAMIGWSRLMAGEWRDPQVGREVFLGALTTFASFALIIGASWVHRRGGGEPTLQDQFSFRTLNGPSDLAAGLLQLVPYAMFITLIWVVVLLLLRRFLRSDYAAVAALAVLTLGLAPTGQWLVIVAMLITNAVGVLLTIRVGFLALVANIVMGQMVFSLPFSPGMPGFVGTLSWIPVAATVAVTLFGLYTSLAGQSIFGSAADET